VSDAVLHWLEAAAPIGRWRGAVEAGVAEGWEAAARRVDLPRMDVVLQVVPGDVIPEIGMVGRAYRPSCFSLSLDPANPRFAEAVADGAVARQVVHELMHCLRMAAIGYDHNLGDAMVSEGLCGHFVAECLGTPPEPWERALATAQLAEWLPRAEAQAGGRHDHAAWFFGHGRHAPPRWAGYSLGFHLVGRYLARHPEARPSAIRGLHAARLLKDAF
jgi:hypothetical protein